MQTLKISYLWFINFESTVLFSLVKLLSKKKIEFVVPEKADLIFIGPYDHFSFKRYCLNTILKKTPWLNFFNNLDLYLLNRKMKPLRIFCTSEPIQYNAIKADYYISSNPGLDSSNHLRLPLWKESIDWTSEGCFREKNMKHSNAVRFGKFHLIEDLSIPQGDAFLKKKGMCIFSSHLHNERKIIYSQFNKHLGVKGFGSCFDPTIKNHNSSNFFKIDIMKNFSFNLCPENSLHPGYYTEKIVDAFDGKCLPVTWADKNVQFDLNKNAFVNLVDYNFDNLKEVAELLKDHLFLKKFSKEPLLTKMPNLEKEKSFIAKILSQI